MCGQFGARRPLFWAGRAVLGSSRARAWSYGLGMDVPSSLSVGLLGLDEIDAYLERTVAVCGGSGTDGAAHSHPYGRDEPSTSTPHASAR
jgi:hypothetical protein